MARRPPDFWPLLHWIADPVLAGDRPLDELLRQATGAGLRWVQYRDKQGSSRDRYHRAVRLAAAAREAGAVFIVNDDIDLALALKADGVHLGQDDFPIRDARRIVGPEKLIGASTHTVDQARAAEGDGADYLGVGPLFHSPTKMARPPLGCAALGDICRAARIPVYAIGGVTTERCGPILSAGARGVAVASALVDGPIADRTRAFLAALRAPKPAVRLDSAPGKHLA